MAKKRPNLVQNLHFWSFWAKYCHFLHILSNSRPKNNVNKVPRWVFRYVGNKTFDFSYKKKDFLPQKRPNWAQNWHFWSIWARPCRLLLCPVSGSVGGCGAWAVSRKTPIYFISQIKVSASFDFKAMSDKFTIISCFRSVIALLCQCDQYQ